ncbi:MAG: hypothetical protein AAF357_11560 [Verrucomicrobiota bacterium]
MKAGRFCILSFAVLLFMPTAKAEDDLEFREWVSSTGNKLEAALVDYDVIQRTVTLRRKNSEELTVKLRQLSFADGEYFDAYLKDQRSRPSTVSTSSAPAELTEITSKAAQEAKYKLDIRTNPDDLGFDPHYYPNGIDKGYLNAILSRLSPGPTTPLTVPRNDIIAYVTDRAEGDHIDAGIISHFLWWDSNGILPVPKGEGLDDKRKFLEREFRADKLSWWEDISSEIYEYLRDIEDERLEGLQATLVDQTTIELLDAVTKGTDLVLSSVSGTNRRFSPEWTNVITVIGVENDTLKFQMWGSTLRAKMATTPAGVLRIGRNIPFIELELLPDPESQQHVTWVAENEQRLFIARETLILTPVFQD